MTTNEANDKIVLGVPGTWKSRTEIVTAIASKSQGFIFAGAILMELATKESFALEIHEHSPRLREAFELAGGDRFEAADLDAIASHTFTLYLLGDGGSLDAARKMMKAACGLVRAGGLAVKVETAGVAHTASGWTELAETDDPWSLYRAYVALVGEGGTFYSCGMHNLGFRDAIVSANIGPEEAGELLETFLLYLLMESPVLKDGETFSLEPDAPRYRLASESCTTYPVDDLFHNPFGMWRLSPAPRKGAKP
jgi:hypothetical protein